MSNSRGGGWRSMTAIGLAVAAMLGAASPAGAHSVTPTIVPPATAAVEDAEFAIQFAGDVTTLPDGDGFLRARIRSGAATPCAATESADPGDRVIFSPPGSTRVEDEFSLAGRYTADEPGTYRICAWIEDGFSSSGPPVAATVTVRPPVLSIAATAPARVSPGEPFDVSVDYQAEVPRYLSVLVVRETRCPVTSRTLGAISGQPEVVADDVEVSGPGSVTATVRLANPGTYLVCGFLDEYFLGSAAAQLVVKAATVTVVPPFRACGSVSGRRAVHSIRARGVSCIAARSLARRWATPRRAPQRLGSYRCFFAGPGRVTCTAGAAQVRFRYRRLPT